MSDHQGTSDQWASGQWANASQRGKFVAAAAVLATVCTCVIIAAAEAFGAGTGEGDELELGVAIFVFFVVTLPSYPLAFLYYRMARPETPPARMLVEKYLAPLTFPVTALPAGLSIPRRRRIAYRAAQFWFAVPAIVWLLPLALGDAFTSVAVVVPFGSLFALRIIGRKMLAPPAWGFVEAEETPSGMSAIVTPRPQDTPSFEAPGSAAIPADGSQGPLMPAPAWLPGSQPAPSPPAPSPPQPPAATGGE